MQTNQTPFSKLPAWPVVQQQAATPVPAPDPKPTRCMCGATVQPDGDLPCGH